MALQPYLIDGIEEADIDKEQLLEHNTSPTLISYLIELLNDWHMLHDLIHIDNDVIVQHILTVDFNLDYINKYIFSRNPNELAVRHLLTHPWLIDYDGFCHNTHIDAVKHIFSTPPQSYSNLSLNPTAIQYIFENNLDHFKLGNEYQSIAPEIAVKYLIEHPLEIDWFWFCTCSNPLAVKFMIQHTNMIKSSINFNNNEDAIQHMLEYRPDLINKNQYLSNNKCDLAVNYLIANPAEIEWMWFSANPNKKAVEYMLLPENRQFINWSKMSGNPSICREDTFILY